MTTGVGRWSILERVKCGVSALKMPKVIRCMEWMKPRNFAIFPRAGPLKSSLMKQPDSVFKVKAMNLALSDLSDSGRNGEIRLFLFFWVF